jgi:hypothetical protein
MDAAIPDATSSLESRLGISLDEIVAAEKSSAPAARFICRSLKAELADVKLAMKMDMSLEDLIRHDRVTNGGNRPARRRGGATSVRRQFFPPPLFGKNRCGLCCQPRHPPGERCPQESWTCYNCAAAGHRAFECPSELVFAFRDEPEPEPDEAPDDEDEDEEVAAAAGVRIDLTLADLMCRPPG